MNRSDNIIPLHRAKPPIVRPLNEREQAYLRDYMEPVRLRNEARRREVFGQPTSLSDYAGGAAAGFLVGIAPFLAMVAVMVWS